MYMEQGTEEQVDRVHPLDTSPRKWKRGLQKENYLLGSTKIKNKWKTKLVSSTKQFSKCSKQEKKDMKTFHI